MIIFRVDMNRFYLEYTNLLNAQTTTYKYVQFYVDPKLFIHMYIVTDRGTVYYYTVHKSRLPEKLNNLIVPKGAILGIEDGTKKTDKVLSDIFKATHETLREFRLKF